jgi:hypothetical protein
MRYSTAGTPLSIAEQKALIKQDQHMVAKRYNSCTFLEAQFFLLGSSIAVAIARPVCQSNPRAAQVRVTGVGTVS